MSNLARPHIPSGSEPSHDDDLTGVRALLSSLPEPDPMPAHLVHRINASLAAEQAQRGAGRSGAPVTPLLSSGRRRRPRLLFGIASAAAAIALLAAISSNVLSTGQGNTTASSAGAVRTSGAPAAGGPESKSFADKAPAAPSRATTPALVQIGLSGTRYTEADFLAQARRLRDAATPGAASKPPVDTSSSFVGTPSRLRDCLSAIGAGDAEAVRADIGLYEGRPAVVIVATTNGIPVAYAVGPGCSHADPAVLHQATPLS